MKMSRRDRAVHNPCQREREKILEGAKPLRGELRSCQFLLAVLTNHRELGGLNNTHLFSYSSEDQKSEISFLGLKSRCWQGHDPSVVVKHTTSPTYF